jgi:ATP adenylyltransferase
MAYNLVMTKKWLMAVPRSKGNYVGIDVNGLGFLGCLLSRDKETTEAIKQVKPFNVLRGVAEAAGG